MYMRGVLLLLALACSWFGALVISVIEMCELNIDVGRPAAESLGGGTVVRVRRGGKGRRPREGNDERVDDLKGQGNDQGIGANGVGNQRNVGNQNGNVVNENVQEKVGNVIVNGNRVACSYKEYLACNPKEYDGKGEEFYPSHEMQKLEAGLWNHTMVGAGHVAYIDSLKIRGMVAAMEPKTIQKAAQISCALTDEAVRNGSIKKEERIRVLGPSVPPATPTMHLEGLVAHASTVTAQCGSTDHVRSTCPRLNRAQGPEGNRPNQVAANNGGRVVETKGTKLGVGHSCWEQRKLANFVSTTFISLLGIDPNELGFRYEIEIASWKLVEIDKVIKGCKLEIEGYVFDIDLIPFWAMEF
ncbi:hypothetical protein Tco_0826299 [Tanacetum coccineum]